METGYETGYNAAIEDILAFMQEKGWDGAVAITKRDFASWRKSK